MEPIGRFFNEDCVSGALEHLDDASVDLIITDPPYGIEGHRLHRHYNRDEGFVIDGYVEVERERYSAFSRAWIAQAERVLRPGGQLYVVSGYTNLYDVLDALRHTSLYEVNHIIWKYNFGVYTSTKFVSSHYHILYYAKPGTKRTFNLQVRYALDATAPGGGSMNYRDREDVWIINREYKPGRTKNKNELPKALLQKIIAYSSNEGNLVCDFFLGGGSTAEVAIGMNRRFVGFEISRKTFTTRVPHLKRLTPGSLLEPLPRPHVVRNRGKAWTPAESKRLQRRYRDLRAAGVSQGAIIEALSREFARGAWAIRKRLVLLRET
jgi:site-specific DNA-methyltransferase (adenine-specific)